jgi:hypothetical protein
VLWGLRLNLLQALSRPLGAHRLPQRVATNPDDRHISTSYGAPEPHHADEHAAVYCKRLTNAFSKKLDNHKAAVAFYAMWFKFARIH